MWNVPAALIRNIEIVIIFLQFSVFMGYKTLYLIFNNRISNAIACRVFMQFAFFRECVVSVCVYHIMSFNHIECELR